MIVVAELRSLMETFSPPSRIIFYRKPCPSRRCRLARAKCQLDRVRPLRECMLSLCRRQKAFRPHGHWRRPERGQAGRRPSGTAEGLLAGRRALARAVAPQPVILQEGDLAGVNDLPRDLGASLIEIRLATRTRICARSSPDLMPR